MGLVASVVIGTDGVLIGTAPVSRGLCVTVSEAIAASYMRSNHGYDGRRTEYLSSVNYDVTPSMKMHC